MASKRPRRGYSHETLCNAVFDVTDGGLSIRQSSAKWGVPRSTLQAKFYGVGDVKDQIQPHLLISKDDEARLVTWVLRQERLGYAPSHSQIRACVQSLLHQRNYKRQIGRHWVSRFIRRHLEIKNKRGRRQEAKRFNSFTPKAVNWFFNIREGEYSWISPENTYNVDEGGIMAGFGEYGLSF